MHQIDEVGASLEAEKVMVFEEGTYKLPFQPVHSAYDNYHSRTSR